MDERLNQLNSWLGETLGPEQFDLHPASVDASFRRYFRVQTRNNSYIAMDAPPNQEDTGPFVRIAQQFHSIGLNVPKVLEQESTLGFLLLSDLGQRLYLDHLDADTVERLYGDALGALVVLQAGTDQDKASLPPYGHTLLNQEMELFRDWYLGHHLDRPLEPGEAAALDQVFEHLAQSALDQPQVWVHRDFHSRNLMLTNRNNPGILDFQDAVYGPVTYDLVSLLRDCYICWPRQQVEEWVQGYFDLGIQSGLPVGESEDQFLKWFDYMGVQRHLKAIGIFARLNHRDGKPGYLDDIPRVMGYIKEVSARYTPLQPLHNLVMSLGAI
ncbi:MAG TPA: aminoglycoside phosphotransferase [Acidiferrobacteraceae bacterium]|nr:aminoglycoside phosphotransferase [Acidiferrobacteraceae bacterium]